jgi:RimJ/RimL family protein N-acetyltransferase
LPPAPDASGEAPRPPVRVRPAGPDDAERLLAWANDPRTRAAGFHPEPIDEAEHVAWLARRLSSPASRLFIGLDAGGTPIGQVRFERHPGDDAEVSIAVAPEARGRGLGRALLAAGIDAIAADPSYPVNGFTARVRPENAASARLFGEAGFREIARTEVDGLACLVLRRD